MKRPLGVIIFGILLIFGALFQMRGLSTDTYKFLFQPLPKKIILVRYYISLTMILLGIVSGIGIFFLRSFFRKTVLFIGFYILYNYLVEGPLFVFRKLPKYIRQIIPTTAEPRVSFILWTTIIVNFIIEFCFSICLIYYFTRPKVKRAFGERNPEPVSIRK